MIRKRLFNMFLSLIMVATVFTFSMPQEVSAGDSEENGLIAYWKFDEDSGTLVNDSSGNDNTGTIYGADWTTGKVNGALELDGVNDYINIPDNNNLDLSTDWTIEGWIYVNSLPVDTSSQNEPSMIVSKWGTTSTAAYFLGLGYSGKIGVGLHNNADYTGATCSSILNLNKWYHIAATLETGQTLKVYINGMVDAINNNAIIPRNSPNPLCIGREPNYSRFFNGTIDEISIWNYALTSTEIFQHYDSIINPKPDFSIISDNITFSDSTPSVDQDITISANIKNIGNIECSADVKFWVGDPTVPKIWTKDNVIRIDIGGSRQNVYVMNPDIIKFPNGTYRMYYQGWDGTSGGANHCILSAFSTDCESWIKEPGIRLDKWGSYDSVINPEVIELSNGTYRMYYAARVSFKTPILSAWSQDGLTWIKESGIRINYGGLYSGNGVGQPNVMKLDNGTYRMYYIGKSGSTYRIFSALSTNGLTWNNEAGIRIDKGGAYDNIAASYPNVIKLINGNFRIFYTGTNDHVTYRILSAISENGFNWTKENGIRLDGGGIYDSHEIHTTEIISIDDNTYRLFYTGFNNSNRRILSATGIFNATQIDTPKFITELSPDVSINVSINFTPQELKDYDIYVTIENVVPYDKNLTNNIASKILKVTYLPPVANAGPNQTVNEGEVVEFDGSESVGSPIPPAIDPNVVAFWHMDEGNGNVAHDSSENEYDGELKGSASWTKGVAGSALKSNGWDNNCETPHIPLNDRSFTVDLWFKLDTGFTYSHLFNQKESTTTHKALHYVVKATDLKLRMGFYSNDLDSNTAVQTEKWYHVAFVYDYTLDWKYIYLNGKLDNDGASNGPFQGASGITRIGHCNGAIDEVRVSYVARTAQEISDYYNEYAATGYWKFDEGSGQIAADSTWNGNDGQLGSTSVADANDPTWVDGKFGKALEFDGNDNVAIPLSSSLKITGKITIEAWVKRLGPTVQSGFGGYGSIAVWENVGESNKGWIFSIDTNDRIRFYYGGTKCIGPVVPLNEWHYYAGVYNGSSVNLYIDGTLVKSVTRSTNTIPSSQNYVYIGGYSGHGFINAEIDEVIIWNRALSGQEIQEYYNSYKEHKIISYEWDFESDGIYDYKEELVNAPDGAFDGKTTHIYGDNGIYTVTLRITDATGLNDEDTCTITVNNVAPTRIAWQEDFETGIDSWENETDGMEGELELVTDDVYEGDFSLRFYSETYDNEATVITYDLVEQGIDVSLNEDSTISFAWKFLNKNADYIAIGLWFNQNWYVSDQNHQMYMSYFGGHSYPNEIQFTEEVGVWYDHTQNIYEDYISIWGEPPPSGTKITGVHISLAFPESQIAYFDALTINGFRVPSLNDEGAPITFIGTVTDPGSDDLTFTWDWGDGTSDTLTTYYNDGVGPDPYPSPWGTYPFSAMDTVEHIYGDNGIYTITLTLEDDDGEMTTYTTTITVNNIDPTVSLDSINHPNPFFILPHEELTFYGSFSDPGWLDSHNATWDFGDGTIVSGTLTEENNPPDATGIVVDIHTYTKPGDYIVTLTVEDNDGGIGNDSITVHVATAEESKHIIMDYIQGLPDEVWDKNPEQRKNALIKKFNAVDHQLDSGAFQGAINKLTNDIREKMDGIGQDWIIYPLAQKELYSMIDTLIRYLEIKMSI